jgi:hypothetical protein
MSTQMLAIGPSSPQQAAPCETGEWLTNKPAKEAPTKHTESTQQLEQDHNNKDKFDAPAAVAGSF